MGTKTVQIIDGKKTCRRCGLLKPLDDYFNSPTGAGGKQAICKICKTERALELKQAKPEQYRLAWLKAHVRRVYGLSWADYLKRYDDQGGACAICRDPYDLLAKGGLVVDHSHETQQVRGLLCNRCNTSLGQFGDSVEGLMRAVDYVQRGPST